MENSSGKGNQCPSILQTCFASYRYEPCFDLSSPLGLRASKSWRGGEEKLHKL
jgi:hypothetical protein